jgi:2,4-dienoyl-CoA reductase-like NADH-dependent reductase (Old Yellow Enzyme family)
LARRYSMDRKNYRTFSEGKIGEMKVRNRLVRSATFDGAVFRENRVPDSTLALYRELAAGGVGLVVAGPVLAFSRQSDGTDGADADSGYSYVRVPGFGTIAEAVHQTDGECRVVAQLWGQISLGPSEGISLYTGRAVRELLQSEIEKIVDCYAMAIADMKLMGFDGVQLHASLGLGTLSYFLSPYTNHRTDRYGGSASHRARIIADIVTRSQEQAGDFPIIALITSTENVEGGIDGEEFPAIAEAVAQTGVDAIQVTGIPWARRGRRENRQPYFLKYVERIDLSCPVILVGGIRNVEQIEAMIESGVADFAALCRPLICEPDLPNRWLRGRGDDEAACMSCDSCSYALHVMRLPHVVCLFKHDRENYAAAQGMIVAQDGNPAFLKRRP